MRLGFALWIGKELVAALVVAVAGVSYLHDVIGQVGAIVVAFVMAGGGIAAARFSYGNRQRMEDGMNEVSAAAEAAGDAAGTARLTAAEVRELREVLTERRRGVKIDTGHRRRREDH